MHTLNKRAVCDMLARLLSTGFAEPQPLMPDLASVLGRLFREMRLGFVKREYLSLRMLEQAFARGELEPVSFAFRCRDDLGSLLRSAFGTLIASPPYAQHSAWAWPCAREASDAWMSGVITRFGALGALLAGNLASCLHHELMFSACENEFGVALVRSWRNIFLAGNFPGGVFKQGTFTVFVA